jgi:hypothetical protein
MFVWLSIVTRNITIIEGITIARKARRYPPERDDTDGNTAYWMVLTFLSYLLSLLL